MILQEPITTKNQLIAYFEAGCKSKENWLIGLEYENLIYQANSPNRAPYEGQQGIKALLTALQDFGWQPVLERGNLIALAKEQATITLEPGGQLELSGAKQPSVHHVKEELNQYLHQVGLVCTKLGLCSLELGFDPKCSLSEMPIMPKQRYDIMRNYMPSKGKLGLEMMSATTAVQVSLDYSSETDLAKKFRVSMAIQPIVAAIFANSPLSEGHLNGYQSYRNQIWLETDPDRCGILSFAFDSNMSFENYVDYALDVPMYFVIRNDTYVNVAGQSFREFIKGKLPGLPKEVPTMTDWANHISTFFPEVRIKNFIEMRGADGGSEEHALATAALWTGLLYDEAALNEVESLTKEWIFKDIYALNQVTPKLGLATPFRNTTVQELARQIVAIAIQGLKNRNIINGNGRDETTFLNYALNIVESGLTPAKKLILAFQKGNTMLCH